MALTPNSLPLKELPLFAELDSSDHWYCLLPELIQIQQKWIHQHALKALLPKTLASYLHNGVKLLHTAIVVAGNGEAYFALYSLRAIFERVALVWTIHPDSPVDTTTVLNQLAHKELRERKKATQAIMEQVPVHDPNFTVFYDVLSQYFAHASKMDGVVLGEATLKTQLLKNRAKALPLLLLLDTGHRLVLLLQALLSAQGTKADVLDAGRKPHFKYDIERYVRVSSYVMCERHSPNKGVPMATLYNGIENMPGQTGITNIYRGGMEVCRYGDPKDRPESKEIAGMAIFGIGRGHDDEVMVKCVSTGTNGERYKLSWPKTLELDSVAIAQVSAHGQGREFPYFDYIGAFISVIER